LYRSPFQCGQVTCIYLEDLANRPNLPLGLQIIQLVIQPKSRAKGFAQQIIQRVQQEQSQTLPRGQLLNLIETILVYKFGSLTTKELEAMLGLSELKQTRVYQEGREEGREEAIAALLQRQFNNFSLPFALFPIMKSLILARIESIPLIMSLCEFITCYANP
jgi:predicted transposase YdaD